MQRTSREWWIDINGNRQQPIWVRDARKYDGKTRRFCSVCGKLCECFVYRETVRCADCSEKAGVPALRCAGLSALTRLKEDRRHHDYTRRVVAAVKKPAASVPALVAKYQKPLQPRSYAQ